MLTDPEVRNAIPADKVYKIKDKGGMFLEVNPKGGKYWRLRFWLNGKEKLVSLGVYPEISLAKARKKRDIIKGEIARGLEPSFQGKRPRRLKDDTSKAKPTFETVSREWYAMQLKTWSPAHGERVLGRLENHLFGKLGNKPIDELRGVDLLPILQEVEARGHNETAHRLRQFVDAISQHAIATGRAERNAGAELRKALAPNVSKERPALTDPAKVGAFLRTIWGYDGGIVVLQALRLSAYTFVRPGELRKAEWCEVNLDAADGPRWEIPASKMKMRRDHIVPLSVQAVQVFEVMRMETGGGQYVFPCSRTNTRPMSDMTVNAALRRMGYDTGNEMCAHGFRAMASTLLHESGWPSDIVERQLAHVEANSVKRIYNRAEHLPERKRLMQVWADYLDALRGGDMTPLRYAP